MMFCLVAYEEEAKQGEKSNFAKALTMMKPGQKLLIVLAQKAVWLRKRLQRFVNINLYHVV